MDLIIRLVTRMTIRCKSFKNLSKLLRSHNNLRTIAFYSTVQTSDSAYFIGGQHISVRNIVAKYYNDKWDSSFNLARGRYGHGSILVGDKTLVIGGWALAGGSQVK